MTRLLTVGLLLVAALPALPCTCVSAVGVNFNETHGAVFRGTVIEKKLLNGRNDMRGRRRYAITFRADEYWQGQREAIRVIYGMDGGSDCKGGSEYEPGKRYLVYVDWSEAKDIFLGSTFWYGWTDILPEGTPMLQPAACVPGGPIADPRVQEVLVKLGKGFAPGSK